MIDVSQKTGTCSKTSFFPSELVGAAGALVNDVPFICGGRHTSVSSAINSCSILKHGRFVSIDPKMPEKRFNSAAIGFISKSFLINCSLISMFQNSKENCGSLEVEQVQIGI